MKSRREYLSFTVEILKLLSIWPSDNKSIVRDSVLIVSLMPCALPILGDFLFQLYGGVYNLTALTENLIALNCIAGMIYMTVCFLKKRSLVKKLVDNLDSFVKFNQSCTLRQADEKANLYAKLFMFYGIVGNIVYMTMPLFNKKQCQDQRPSEKRDANIPCGLVTRCRLPFKFDYTPLFEIVFVHQFYTCTMVTVVILDLTMLLCGFLLHITSQLHQLRSYVADLKPGVNLVKNLRFCIEYHIAIITYSKKTNEAFSTMMMLHLTLTSLVISALGFEILIVNNFNDSLRFSLHLVGWLVLLLLICYYGQNLIDESVAVAEDIYFVPWHQLPVKIQKDVRMILMRSQKPLSLSAANMGVMSFPTFLRVISSAYSYFTLLWNIKS